MNNINLTPSPQQNMSGHVRRASYSKTSSASCANAKPNEDWTKMTDLAERRRVQNRIAQRNYRQKLKKRLERAGELEQRAVSTSPPSTNAPLGGSLSSPETRNRSLSTGPVINTNFVAQQSMHPFQELFPEQFSAAQDDQFSVGNEGYLNQPMTPTQTPVSYSFPGYTQSVPASYTGFPQGIAYSNFPPVSTPYVSSMHHTHYPVGVPPMTTASGITPITPTSQGDCYPQNDGPSYAIDYTQAYENPELPTTQPYTGSASSVNLSDFFPQNYPSS